MNSKNYSWGELYETLNEMRKNGEEISDPILQRGLTLFLKLDRVVFLREIYELLENSLALDRKRPGDEDRLTLTDINKIFSPCLDGLILMFRDHYYHEYKLQLALLPIETIKFLFFRGIITDKKDSINDNYTRFYRIRGETHYFRGARKYIDVKEFMNNVCMYGTAKTLEVVMEWISTIPSDNAVCCAIDNSNSGLYNILIANGAVIKIEHLIWGAKYNRTDVVQTCVDFYKKNGFPTDDGYDHVNCALAWAREHRDKTSLKMLKELRKCLFSGREVIELNFY